MLLTAIDERVGGQQLERVDLEEERVKEQVSGRRARLRVLAQTLADEVLLQRVVEGVDRPADVILCDQSAGVSVALDLQRRHL